MILTTQEIKCLRKHLKPLVQLLDKLDKGAVPASAPIIEKKETEKQRMEKYNRIFENKEAKKLKRKV